MADPNDSSGRMSVTNLQRYEFSDGIKTGCVTITKYQCNVGNYPPKAFIKTVKKKDNMNEGKPKTKMIRKFNDDRMKYAKRK